MSDQPEHHTPAPGHDAALHQAGTIATAPAVGHLQEAAAMLGPGELFTYLVESDPKTGLWSIDTRPRVAALLDVATAIAEGRRLEQTGRRVSYRSGRGPSRFDVKWCAKSERPTVGHYPEKKPGPIAREALHVLLAAGLTPAKWGDPISPWEHPMEQFGFAVSDMTPAVWGRAYIDDMGSGAASAQHQRVPEVLRAAGWTVTRGGSFEPWTWAAVPPGQDGVAPLAVQARAELSDRGETEAGAGQEGFTVAEGEGPDEVVVTATWGDPQLTEARARECSRLLTGYIRILCEAGWARVSLTKGRAVFRAPQPKAPNIAARDASDQAARLLKAAGYQASAGVGDEGFTTTASGFGKVIVEHWREEAGNRPTSMLWEHYAPVLRAAGWKISSNGPTSPELLAQPAVRENGPG
ncbi:hypothetical protein ACH4UT_10435 [Streptomyces sp. NPDC020799]|uniref:hypothetical protein n=1 Tax=Streptomyces sp. NPDC020799 TaxID=3365091 RepID=UPI00379F6575